MVERYQQLSYLVFGIHKSIQKIAKEEMEKHGLRGAYAQYLVAMSHFQEGLTSARLCEICDKDKAATSRFVAEMEEKGLIKRESGNFSMYRAKLTLTESGQKITESLLKKVNIAVEIAGRGLTEDSRTILYSSLEIIKANLKEICKIGIPD